MQLEQLQRQNQQRSPQVARLHQQVSDLEASLQSTTHLLSVAQAKLAEVQDLREDDVAASREHYELLQMQHQTLLGHKAIMQEQLDELTRNHASGLQAWHHKYNAEHEQRVAAQAEAEQARHELVSRMEWESSQDNAQVAALKQELAQLQAIQQRHEQEQRDSNEHLAHTTEKLRQDLALAEEAARSRLSSADAAHEAAQTHLSEQIQSHLQHAQEMAAHVQQLEATILALQQRDSHVESAVAQEAVAMLIDHAEAVQDTIAQEATHVEAKEQKKRPTRTRKTEAERLAEAAGSHGPSSSSSSRESRSGAGARVNRRAVANDHHPVFGTSSTRT